METSEIYEIQSLDVDKAIRAVDKYMKHFDEQKPEVPTTTQTHLHAS